MAEASVLSHDSVARWHGKLGSRSWPAPKLVAEAAEENRPGFAGSNSHEYEDSPEVLNAKAAVVADLIRKSRYTVAYTGAGISTSAGIGDYATKASQTKVRPKGEDSFAAQPTMAHRIFVGMQRDQLLHHWLQQNHDGLPQKAGCPQEVINELHGAWFDPANPVVHFRAELRPHLFAWMLDTELRADLVIAVGTSLCETPSTADRFVVSASCRATEEPPTSLGAVVVGLQTTRLDEDVQIRVFGLIDKVFELVAAHLWGDTWEEHLPRQPHPDDAAEQSDPLKPAENSMAAAVLEDRVLAPGTVVYITGGPYEGRANRVAKVTPQGNVVLDCGMEIGAWWMKALPHPARFPVQPFARRRPVLYTRVLDAFRMCSLPSAQGPPLDFLAGSWRGEAILLDDTRAYHPTAPGERAQHIRWVLGSGEEAGTLIGAGHTTWPAALVLLNKTGRVWFTLTGKYDPAEGGIEIRIRWEPIPGSRLPPQNGEKLGLDQGEPIFYSNEFVGRVWWDGRRGELCIAGSWTDEEGVTGALFMVRDDEVPAEEDDVRPPRAGTWLGWCSTPTPEQTRWALAAGSTPMGIYGVSMRPEGLALIRGVAEDAGVMRLRERAPNGRDEAEISLKDLGVCLSSPSRGQLQLRLADRYAPLQPMDLLGSYQHSAGCVVDVVVDPEKPDHFIIYNPRLRAPEQVALQDSCRAGAARLHNQLGRWAPNEGRIEWTNGATWARIPASAAMASTASASGYV